MGATGTATLDFGAFPGASDASLVITGQVGILAGSLIEAWLRPAATADHTADEHVVETLQVMAGNIVAGTGFTIYGVNTSQINEPLEVYGATGGAITVTATQGPQQPTRGGRGTRLYGAWSVAWVWN